MKACEIMTKNPTTVQITNTVQDVVDEIMNSDVRHIPVLDGRELIGVVSDRDLRSFTYPPGVPQPKDSETTNEARLDSQVTEILQGGVISVQPETEVKEIIDIMIDEKIGAIPVIDPATRHLAGIISYVDIIREAQDYFS